MPRREKGGRMSLIPSPTPPPSINIVRHEGVMRRVASPWPTSMAMMVRMSFSVSDLPVGDEEESSILAELRERDPPQQISTGSKKGNRNFMVFNLKQILCQAISVFIFLLTRTTVRFSDGTVRKS